MQENKKTGTEISLNQIYKLLEKCGVPEDESFEFLRLPWVRNSQGDYEAFPVIEEKDYSTETYKTKRMFLDDVKELIRIATIFKKFYEKKLIRNVREFNDFWIYAGGNAIRLEEIISELEIIGRANQQYKLAFEKERELEKEKIFSSNPEINYSLKSRETPSVGLLRILES